MDTTIKNKKGNSTTFFFFFFEIAESLNISDYAAQYLINNIPMDGTSPMSWEFLKEQLDNYTKQIENLQ